jgi:hypothetical protein
MPVLFKVRRRSSRSTKYDVWRFLDYGDGGPTRISNIPEETFDDAGEASRYCALLNEDERAKSIC